ncbi:MAG: ABC transporter substrate-binding protein [Phycisphaerales bacterium]|nr:ABC transporter substrate-binding protein [Phycisphaerales bacterium]
MSDRLPILLAHSPDPDDAFMWWPLIGIDGGPPAIDTGRFAFRTVPDDIESLNRRAEQAEFDVTAISCAQYARVARDYALTACGASVGDGYGPKLVARGPMATEEIAARGLRVAVPGERTTAFLVASLMIGPGRFAPVPMPFDEILEAVADGRCDAGVVIHEGQLTFETHGLHLVADLGAWWTARTGLPLPLGANAIRRDLDDRFGAGTLEEVTTILARSVEHALDHRDASVAYAMGFARGLTTELADRFVSMYVNHWTLDYGPRGRAAVRRLLEEAADAGLGPRLDEVAFVAADAS